MFYLITKDIHIFLVGLSIFLFNWRYFHHLFFPNRTLRKIFRRLPHFIDTFLLISGIILAWILKAVPFDTAQWLGLKLILLVLYILFGYGAMHAKPRSWEAIFAYVMAMLCIVLMVILVKYQPIFWR